MFRHKLGLFVANMIEGVAMPLLKVQILSPIQTLIQDSTVKM